MSAAGERQKKTCTSVPAQPGTALLPIAPAGAARGVTKPQVRERDFLQAVRRLARLLRWMEYHTWRSLKSTPGFPDVVLVRPPRLVVAELKVGKRKPTEAQRDWMEALGSCPPVEAYYWWPEDWDEIIEVLR
jgi:hypothetical protein